MSETFFYGGTKNFTGIGTISAIDAVLTNNLTASNIIMSSNLSTNTGLGNVYLTGNLVVSGNLFSSGGSVGSGSGTSQGVLLTLPSAYSLSPNLFVTSTGSPVIQGFHLNLGAFVPEAAQAVTVFTVGTGMIKFSSSGLYQVTCVLAGDQPLVKVGIGVTTSSTFSAMVAGTTATSGYSYVYNLPIDSSPSTTVTLPLGIVDTSKYYYIDAYFLNGATQMYASRSSSAAGTNYGTYIQIAPFGNYLSSATGVASALLCNCSSSSNLSGVYSSNTYRVALTSSNGWTVTGTSTALAVTANGNFQANQSGIYEVNLCLNTVGNTPVKFQVGSLASDALSPGGTTPSYLYSYSPMYTQDPTTTISLPLNITNISNVYFIECSFQGTITGNVALSATSTFVTLKPIGGYINTGTNPWVQQGTTVYYSNGLVGVGGVNPAALTETLTVNGNTSFVGNVSVVSDASSNNYVVAKRVPAGSLSVSNYVTGSVPLSTTTNLIQNYLSNAAAITSNTGTGSITQALSLPGTANSDVFWPNGGHSIATANLALSNLFIEAWINPSTSFGANGIILQRSLAGSTPSGNADFNFYLSSGNFLNFTVSNASVNIVASNASALSAGTWYHVSASYTRTATNAGTARVFINGGIGGTTGAFTTGTQPQLSPSANVVIGTNTVGTAPFSGNVADVRVMTGCIVPTASFTPAAAPFTTAPTYVTGMSTGYTSNLTLALQSQYFPGASTSPYGPCLTLPGTVGSYYTQSTTALNTSLNSGFTIEAWVNYASFANANLYANGGYSFFLAKGSPTTGAGDWLFGPLVTGQVSLYWWNGSSGSTLTTSGTITTGSWNHIVAQGNTAGYVNIFINGVIQTLTAGGYSGSGTSVALNGTATSTAYNGVTIGQSNNNQGPNFAVAKARVLFGANTYTTTTFTPSPNLGPIPVGGTVAWQLESQYPLPTYPSIQDVTELPQQASSYGSLPTPVGGVTSNTLSPYTGTQLQSLRFDGTGYIDYGNAASSVVNSNLWANSWTIEGWVYMNNLPTAGSYFSPINRSSTEWGFYVNSAGNIYFQTPNSQIVSSAVLSPSTWYHFAATFDGARCNVYMSNQLTPASGIMTSADQVYIPTNRLYIGALNGSSYYLAGNLADVRVSNVARYTGSSYTVPSASFTNDANTLLLLKSLAQQPGTTLEVQGRGLNSTSLGASRTINAYPPAPMSSYLLDTTSNSLVSYGQGKYVASASSEYDGTSTQVWKAFDQNASTVWASSAGVYSLSNPQVYTGSVRTVDVLGNSYAGEWAQIQLPVSVVPSSTSLLGPGNSAPSTFYILGSRDGLNWTLVDSRSGISGGSLQTFTLSCTQAYNFYRLVVNVISYAGSSSATNVTSWTLNGTEESLCITNDAKIGVGIANPQRSLEVAGDVVVGGTVSAGNPLMYRNRIINGDMRIAQRGTSITITGSAAAQTYLIDRFNFNYGLTTGQVIVSQRQLTASDTPYQLGLRYSMNVYISAGCTSFSYMEPQQNMEGLMTADFMWGTPFGAPATFSLWYRANWSGPSEICCRLTESATSNTYHAPFTSIGSGTWQYLTFTVPPPPNGVSVPSDNSKCLIWYIAAQKSSGSGASVINQWTNTTASFWNGSTNWYATAGNYIEFTGVQLEKGTVATPFEVRPYATELALCQRYFTQLGGQTLYDYYGVGDGRTTTVANIMVPLPVVMRSPANSTVTGISVGNMQLLNGSTPTSVTSVSKDQHSLNCIGLNVGVASGLTAGSVYIFLANNSAAPLIQINNEL